MIYFALLAFAIVMNEGLGGPLALPGMMLFALIAGVVVAAVFALVTALAEWICNRRALSIWHQIPVSTGILVVVVLAGGLLFWQLGGRSGSNTALVWSIGFVLLLLPLAAYWWTLQSADWLLNAGARAVAKVF